MRSVIVSVYAPILIDLPSSENLERDNGSRDRQSEESTVIKAAHATAQSFLVVTGLSGDEVQGPRGDRERRDRDYKNDK